MDCGSVSLLVEGVMLRLLSDEDFSNRIVRGLRRRDIDIVRVQDTEVSGADDSAVLEWAASQNRILLTHDVSTISRHAYDRVRRGLKMPGVFEAAQSLPIGQAIDDILLLTECSQQDEWEGQVRHLPL